MTHSQKIKSILKTVLIWIGLTIFFLIVDDSLNAGKKLDWFPVIALLLPALCAILYAVWSLGPTKFASKQKEIKKAPVPPPTENPTEKRDLMSLIDEMEGHDFERFCAELLDDFGYQQIHVTKSSGDQGVDIIAVKGGLRYAFQCKRYSSKIGNAAIQQVNTGKMLYSCQKAVVITNNYFTSGAKQAAKAVGVELWDRDVLQDKIGRVVSRRGKPRIK